MTKLAAEPTLTKLSAKPTLTELSANSALTELPANSALTELAAKAAALVLKLAKSADHTEITELSLLGQELSRVAHRLTELPIARVDKLRTQLD